MPKLPERKRLTIQRLLEFGVSKIKISRVMHASQLTVQNVERGYVRRHCPSPREIERLKMEICESWSEKVRTIRMRRKGVVL